MRDTVLWRKETCIIMLLAEVLQVDAEQAMNIFYSSDTYRVLSDPKYGLHLMSDRYIVDDILSEMSNRQ